MPLAIEIHFHLKLLSDPLWIDTLTTNITEVFGFWVIQDLAAGYIEYGLLIRDL